MTAAIARLAVHAALLATACAPRSMPTRPPPAPLPPGPSEATCRRWLEQGTAAASQRRYDEARARFHDARRGCDNPVSLVLIARSYQDQGDPARALAYAEMFLAETTAAHELRPAMEAAARELRQRVPPDKRVSIDAELETAGAAGAAEASLAVTAGAEVSAGEVDAEGDGEPASDAEIAARSIAPERGLVLGANVAYAAMARAEIARDGMNAAVDFPSAYAAELQVGYRLLPYLTIALAPQMLFNLRPEGADPAREVDLFVQATGHHAVNRRWDVTLFAAPGYGRLLLPGADDAGGPIVRWGGGATYHLSPRISLAAELSHQIGFQTVAGADVDTSFFSFVPGVRLRL